MSNNQGIIAVRKLQELLSPPRGSNIREEEAIIMNWNDYLKDIEGAVEHINFVHVLLPIQAHSKYRYMYMHQYKCIANNNTQSYTHILFQCNSPSKTQMYQVLYPLLTSLHLLLGAQSFQLCVIHDN